jgi:phosphatidylinositol alpha-1,6-mannosyltransferase
MKYLLFTLEYPPFRGGVANYYGNLAKFWPVGQGEGGADGSLAVLHNNDNQLINDKLPFFKWLPAITELRRMVRKEKIGHVLVGHVLPLGTATWLVSKITRIRYSVIIHGTDLNSALARPRRRWLAGRILAGAENIICNSSFAAGLCENFIGKDKKIKVVNPGLDPRVKSDPELESRLRTKYDLGNKPILLTVGRLVTRKGVDKVLESMPVILQHVPNLVYIIVGNGPDLEALKLQINDYLLNKNAMIITDATDEERNAWYDLCDIFIVAGRQIGSDVEGFGIVYLEAGLHGKPVIAGDSGGVRDAVEDNLNGLLIDPTDTAAIARAVAGLAKDETLRRQLGEQGRERALARFSWQKQIMKIYNIVSDNAE